MNKIKIYLCGIIYVALASFSFFAQAFKVDTHVWIAQEIIDDIQDGTLNINGIEIPVEPELKNLIIKNQEAFRAGSIGPDAAPDILVGQMLIHPGQSGGAMLKTNEWLQYIERSAGNLEEFAYAKGMWVHAAADVMAHTYVNMYAGDVFDLGKHLSGHSHDTEPDRRHFMLESYIGQFTPNLSTKKEFYNVVRYPKRVATTPRKSCEDTKKPLAVVNNMDRECSEREFFDEQYDFDPTLNKDNFIMRTFFYDADALRLSVLQNKKGPVVYPEFFQYYNSPSARHIKSIYSLRYRVEQLIQSDELNKIDEIVAKAIVYYWTGTELKNPQVLVDLAQDIQELDYKSTREINRVRGQIEDVLENSNLKLNSVTQKLANEADRNLKNVHSISVEIFDLQDRLRNAERELQSKVCKWFTPKYICNLIDDLKREIYDLDSKINRRIADFTLNKNNLSKAVRELNEAMRAVNLIRRGVNDVTWDIVLVAKMDINPIRALLKNWAMGIDATMVDYQYVGLDMMKNAMHPTEHTAAPLKTWAFTNCGLAKLIGIGDKLGDSSCRLYHSVKALEDELAFLEPIVSGIVPIKRLIEKEIEKIVKKEVEQLKYDLSQELFNSDYKDIEPELVNFLELVKSKEVTDTILNREFDQEGTPNVDGYLSIPDVAERIKSEMGLTVLNCNGKSQCFDKNKFPVIRNAVTLAKMSLLNNSQLRVLAEKLNLPTETFVQHVNQKSILDSTVFNIDGNHQWSENHPSYPRVSGYKNYYFWELPALPFGNGRLFGDSLILGRALESLFVGPLEKGLFTPNNIGGFKSVLPVEYLRHYYTCVGHPFVTGQNDSFCLNSIDPDPYGNSSVGGTGNGSDNGGGKDDDETCYDNKLKNCP